MKRIPLLTAAASLLATAAMADDPAFSARALLQPRHEALLSAEIAARIAELPKREGESFAKGEPLVRFDCALYQAQRAEAEAELLKARKKLANDRQLAALDSIGALEVELSAAEVARTRAQLEHRSVYVERCTIPAPFDGKVVERKVHTHESVTAGTELLSVLDDTTLELKVIVPSSWLGWLRPGTPLQVRVDETGQEVGARVIRIGARIDPVSQSLPIVAELEGPVDGLIAGMSANVTFGGP